MLRPAWRCRRLDRRRFLEDLVRTIAALFRLRLAALCLAPLNLVFASAAMAQPTAKPAAAPALELFVLGSGGPGATGRAGSSYVVLVDGVARIYVDAGPGSFVRLGESKLALDNANIVLLTHLHVDHAGELPGLFKARAVSSLGPIEFKIFGPDGREASEPGDGSFPSTSVFVDLLFGKNGAFRYLKGFSAPLAFKVTDIAAPPVAASVPVPRTIYADGDLGISAVAGHHQDAPAIIYRIDHAGRSITFSGDIDATGLPALRRIAQETSLLVFNSVVLDPPGSPEVLYALHTPPDAIGKVADACHAGRLLLSHLSPVIDQHRDAVKASIAGHYHGPVVFAEDGLRMAP
jgi:ribonuclease BN (tRNA processing enzyme)